MAKLPAKYEWIVDTSLNTYAVKDQLKAMGLRYGDGPMDTGWHADSEEKWMAAVALARTAGTSSTRVASSRGSSSRVSSSRRRRGDGHTSCLACGGFLSAADAGAAVRGYHFDCA